MAELRRMANASRASTGQGGSLNLDGYQTRWMTVGIAINKVLVPQLRIFVEGVMKELYQKLLFVNPPFNQQVYNQQHRTWGNFSLEYKNINGNDKVTAKPPKPHYNYNVTNHLNLSRLFLQPFMSKFNTFGDTDASALLSLMLNVDDTNCNTPKFAHVKTGAQDVKDIRNEWAHCNFQHWDVSAFNQSFQTMSTILKHVVPGSVQQSILAELTHIQQNGPDLCKDHSVQMDVLRSLTVDIGLLASEVIEGKQNICVLTDTLKRVQDGFQGWKEKVTAKLVELDTNLSVLFEVMVREFARVNTDLSQVKTVIENRRHETLSEDEVGKYCQKLLKYHDNALKRLLQQLPKLYDVEKYVQLKLCQENVNFQEGSGLDEYITNAQVRGSENISPERLFDIMKTNQDGPLDQEQVPRTVVIAGVPGGGKTITAYFLLKKIMDKEIFQAHAKFPFFIRFRDLNVHKEPLSFQSLLLKSHGPSTQNQESLWDYIVEHQDKVTFILDGYDEFNGLGATKQFSDMKEATTPQVLMYNLISGHIMEEAKVILTTRPHCVQNLRRFALNIRLVSLGALDIHGLQEMIKQDLKDFPALHRDVTDYIRENSAVQSLCSVPINARSLLDHIRWTHRDSGHGTLVKDKCLAKDSMPQTMAGLLFVLDLKMLQISDRNLSQQGKLIAPEKILAKRRDFLQKLARLALSGVLDRIKVRFTEEDIEAFGLIVRDLEGSIMTCSEVVMEGTFGPVTEKFYSFPHLTQQENLAGLHLTQKPVEEIEELVIKQWKKRESLLQMYLGACGDNMITKYLPHIYPDPQLKDYRVNANRVVKAIWESTYHLNHMYAVRMWHESQQLDMVPDLVPYLCNRHGVLMLPQCRRLADIAALCQFIGNLPRSGFTGVWFMPMYSSAGCVMQYIKTQIKKNTALVSLVVELLKEDVLAEWASGDYSNLQCLKLVTNSLDLACQPLHTCQHLDTLVLTSFVRQCLQVTALTSLKYLKHLSISGIFMLSVDISGVCDVVMNDQLSLLHLQNIHIDDNEAVLLSHCLSNQACRLRMLRLDRCVIGASGYRAICESLKQNRQLTALGITGIQYGASLGNNLAEEHDGNILIEAVSHLLVENTITELDIQSNGTKDITQLCGMLHTNSTLSVLDLSDNTLSPTSMSQLCAVLTNNTSLEALLIDGLGGESAQALTASLTRNTSLKLLSVKRGIISAPEGSQISESCIVELMERTHLEVLDVRYVTLTNVNAVAQALCRSSFMKALGLGVYSDDTRASFLNVLCECYPLNGPLQALYMPWSTSSVERARATALAIKLRIPHLVRQESVEVDIAADLGYKWRSLPPERRLWLLNNV